jgi:PIN domain nuclease of toxin-antitoxin system
LIPIEEDHVIEIEKLPWIHRDPFDRLLIATANIRKIPIVTSDRNIKQYNVSHIW